MTAIDIRNRLDRLEHATDGHQRVVVVFTGQTDEEAFTRAGAQLGDGVACCG